MEAEKSSLIISTPPLMFMLACISLSLLGAAWRASSTAPKAAL